MRTWSFKLPEALRSAEISCSVGADFVEQNAARCDMPAAARTLARRLREDAATLTALGSRLVPAFDHSEACVELCRVLGLKPVPCCELDAEPCPACASQDQARQEDEGAEREAYRERQDPGVLRAQDADRGGRR